MGTGAVRPPLIRPEPPPSEAPAHRAVADGAPAWLPSGRRTVGQKAHGADRALDHPRHVREIDSLHLVVGGVVVRVQPEGGERVGWNALAGEDDVVAPLEELLLGTGVRDQRNPRG